MRSKKKERSTEDKKNRHVDSLWGIDPVYVSERAKEKQKLVGIYLLLITNESSDGYK